MAEILRGKHKGKTANLIQFANDWVMLDLTFHDGPANLIAKPSSIRTTPEETRRFEVSMDDPRQRGFWAEWILVTAEDGTSTFQAARPRVRGRR
jgi:hypothetical protein